jgi:hypothetical protein
MSWPGILTGDKQTEVERCPFVSSQNETSGCELATGNTDLEFAPDFISETSSAHQGEWDRLRESNPLVRFLAGVSRELSPVLSACEQEVLRILLLHGGLLDEKRLFHMVCTWSVAEWAEALSKLEAKGIVARSDDVTILLENAITDPVIAHISGEVKTDNHPYNQKLH